MADLQGFGRALQGFGAGVAGRGQQFLQGLDDNRKNALLQDAFAVQQQLASGDVSGARATLMSRLDAGNRLGGSVMSDTQALLQKLESGDVAGALTDVGTVVSFAQSQGLLKAPAQTTQQDQADLAKTVAQTSKLDVETKEAKARLEKLINTPANQVDLKDIQGIQKDITTMISEPLKIRNAAARLEKIGQTKSATDQLAAVFTFMKALDPTSVVREGEQAQARSTGGIADQMIGFVNRIQGEGALPEDVFNNMIATSKRLSNQASSDNREQVLRFIDTFGDRLPADVVKKTMARLPTLFDTDKTIRNVTVDF